jgi:ADP-ribose pyrophosphatase
MRWDVVSSEIIYGCPVFSVRRDASRARDGREHDFHVIETRDWVNVVPITANGDVVLVRQFRHGIRDLTLEVPAGIIDPTDSDPAVAARRELREETGYDCAELRGLGTVHPNPAIMNNQCHMFVAYGARQVGAPQWDGTEELEVTVVPLDTVPDLIRSGALSNALTIVAFHLLQVTGHPRR